VSARLTPALRPMLPADAPVLATIFRASIEELTVEDYSPQQQAAWMAVADDEKTFATRLAKHLTLIATIAREPAGFASLKGADHIDMLYVHPRAWRQGVGKALCDALELLAASRNAKAITVDASDTAQEFFTHRGYTAVRRNLVTINGEALGNVSMKKNLPARTGTLQ
jgi:putative acetyltransferase